MEQKDSPALQAAIAAVERQDQGKRIVSASLARLVQLQALGNQQMALVAQGLAMVEGCGVQIKEMTNDPATGQLHEIVYVTEAGVERTLRVGQTGVGTDGTDAKTASGLVLPR